MKKLVFSMAALAFMYGVNAEPGSEQEGVAQAYEGEDLKPGGVFGGLGFNLINSEWQSSTTYASFEEGNAEKDSSTWRADGNYKEAMEGHDYTNNITKVVPNVFLGYGFLYKNFFIAPEAFVRLAPNVTTYNSRTDISNTNSKYSENSVKCNGIQPGFDIKLGYYCPKLESVVYAKFGTLYKKFTVSDTEYLCDGWATGETPASDPYRVINVSNSKKFSNWRFFAGLGMSKALSKSVTLSGEITYTLGKKMNMLVSGSAIRDGGEEDPSTDAREVRMSQNIEHNDKGSIDVGIYAQWNIWAPNR